VPLLTQVFTSNGTFTVPAGVTGLAFVGWGPGGAGVDGTAGMSGPGGGGGACVSVGNILAPAAAATPGDNWSITVGAAGSGTDTKVTNPSLSDVLVAKAATSTFGGAAGSCTGDVKRSGGNGGAAGAAVGGGGGSAPSDTTAANNGTDGDSGGTGGAAVSGTFTYTAGGQGGDAPTGAATAPGAGGGGGNAAGSTTGGAAAAGKVVVFYLTVDTPTLLGGYRPIEVIGMNTNPTPGGVLFHRVKGVADAPPPIAGIGPPNRWRVETPSPPAFPGGILAVINQFGTPPPSVAVIQPVVVATASPPPFPGQVLAFVGQDGPTPLAGRSSVIPPVAVNAEPFPGAVIRAKATEFGLSPLPSRPVLVQTPSPPSFPGQVIVGQRRVAEARIPTIPPASLDAIPFPGQVLVQAPKRGTELRGQPVVAAMDPPPPFAGDVVFSHPIGLANRIPARAQTIALAIEQHPEPGSVVALGGRSAHVRPPTVAPVRLPDPAPAIVQPVAWSGVPARPAAARGVQVASLESPVFPGGVAIARNPFGSSPLPGPRSIVRLDPAPRDPGAVIVAGGRAAHITVPRPATIAAAESPAFPGAVHVRVQQTSDPRVFSRSIVIGSDFAIAAMIQPFVMSGVSIGEIPLPPPVPPDPPAVGVIITIAGTGHASLTISSSDCECC